MFGNHCVHWGIDRPSFLLSPPPPPPLNLQTVQAPFFYANSPLYIGFSGPLPPPLKSDFSVNPHNIKICHP